MRLFNNLFKGNKLNANEIAICTDSANKKYKELDNYLEKFKTIPLYEKEDSAIMTGTINLSASAAEYKSVIINARSTDGEFTSVEIFNPNGKKVSLMTEHSGSTSSGYFITYNSVPITISEKKIIINEGRQLAINKNQTFTSTVAANAIVITGVYGRK